MYDPLWEEHPKIRQIRAESFAQGKASGETKSIQAAQEIIVVIVKARFPNLADVAKEQVRQVKTAAELRMLAKQIATAPDEATASWVLTTLAA